jgi:methylthioribose-1-phosphate isomerase
MATRKSECTGEVRPVYFENGHVYLIDQKVLPNEFKSVVATTPVQVWNYIKDMTVRGAPAIGAAGAFAMAMSANDSTATDVQQLLQDLTKAKAYLDSARPTAVNLMWATGRMLDIAQAYATIPNMTVATLKAAMTSESQALAELDVEINRSLAKHGSTVVPDKANILHHCNTGALATVDIGTALGVIYECHKSGKGIHVWVDETRPRLQGSKLTAWELMKGGVPMHLIADNAAGHLMQRGKVDIFLFGADRVAANGDVANKVGTYKNCVVAKENGVPVYACVPTSTIDLNIANGFDIHIEERPADEVTHVGNTVIAPEGVPVFNPAFDMTPHRYLTGIITEEGICYPPFHISLKKAKETAEERAKIAWQTKLKSVTQ